MNHLNFCTFHSTPPDIANAMIIDDIDDIANAMIIQWLQIYTRG